MFQVEAEVINRIDIDVNIIKARLPRPTFLSWINPALNYVEVFEQVNRFVPQSPDIVDWMRDVAATKAILDMFAQSTSINGGVVVVGSDDPFIPGLRVEDTYFQSMPADDVVSRGRATLVTPVGNFDVPFDGKALITKGNFLAWACARDRYLVQWIGTIIRYKVNPEARLGRDVRDIPFPMSKNFTAPVVLDVVPPLSIRHVDYLEIYSERDQNVNIIFTPRGTYDVQLGAVSVNVPSGVSTIRIRVFGASPYTVIVQPSDGVSTHLQMYSVRRI
ncbi:MAG: hypothetical protein QXD57_07480 [Ignisphaera sp.]